MRPAVRTRPVERLLTPITPIIETIRGLVLGTDYGNQPVSAVGWCPVMLIGAIVWIGWPFRRRAARNGS